MVKHFQCISQLIFAIASMLMCANSHAKDLAFTQVNNPDMVKYLPGYGKVSPGQFSGYLNIATIAASKSEPIYYYLVSASQNPQDAPVVLWLNGGPGSSSFYGFFTENGPYTIDNKLKLHDNQFGWNKKFNYLIMDQPVGVGYSYASKNYSIKDEAQTTQELYLAIRTFYQKYPDLLTHKLFITGESYAGRYIPEVALTILQQNSLNNIPKIPLAGIILGDAWVDPLIQQSADARYAYSHGLIDEQGIKVVDDLYKKCALAINATQVSTRKADFECGKMSDYIYKSSGIDLHNIHNPLHNTPTDKYAVEYSSVEKYLNLPNVKQNLHVAHTESFTLFNDKVAKSLEVGEQNSVASIVKELLNQKLKVLIYNGLDDAKDCNFMGTNLWLKSLNFGGFNFASQEITFNSSGQVMGYTKNYKNLTYVKLFNAGHMAAEDQPQNTLEMLERFNTTTIPY